jgi:hypothetical protein
VKTMTDLMRTGEVAARQRLHEAYAAQAFASSQVPAEARARRTKSFVLGWLRVWRIPWENANKEVLWRLAVNGVSGAGGCDICLQGPCACGGGALTAAQIRSHDSTPLRQHAFWDCPVAQAVVRQLQRGLGNRPLAQWNVWLLQPPRRVRIAVWRVVALAALSAMEVGRRALFREWVQRDRPEEPRERTAAARVAAATASAAFWLALHDFAKGGRSLKGDGWDAVGHTHPFLAMRTEPPLLPVLRVMMPA